MMDFLGAAFPWIVMGIALALFAANHVREKRRTDKESEARDNRISEGMCLGMCFGVVLGTTGVCDLATGISLGLLLGEVVGMCMKK